MKITIVADWEDLHYSNGKPTVAGEVEKTLVRQVDGSSFKTLFIILPCLHPILLDKRWVIEDYASDSPTAKPSIWCKGNNAKNCWHGWLTKGELHT